MKVKLQFLGSDFNESNYMNTHDCAITRALYRAGIKAIDCGTYIRTEGYKKDSTELTDFSNKDYRDLVNKVTRTYDTLNPEDFEWELELDIDKNKFGG